MNSVAEPCVVGDPARCAYAGEDGKDACKEECLVAKGRRGIAEGRILLDALIEAEDEFKVDIYRGGGTVVRVTHLPTGMVEQREGVHGQHVATENAKAALRVRLGYAENS